VQRIAVLPSIWRDTAATMTSKINDNGIAGEDGRVADEVRHECVFNGAFCGLAIGEQADMVAGDMEIVHKPTPHFERVIDTRRQIPNLAGLVLVDPNNEGENRGNHPTGLSSVNATFV